METYHKIQTLFKREQTGKRKGKMIRGDWTTPELEYLAGNQWEFTEKVDGTNIRIGWDGLSEPEFGGRTDRAAIPERLMGHLETTFSNDLFWSAFPDLHAGTQVVLFGEGYGPKIQNGGNYSDEHKFVLFDVKVGDWWLARKDVDDIAEKLGIESVPTIGYGTLQDAIDIVADGYTFNKQGAIVRYGAGTLQSRWGNFAAEGIVARPVVPMFDLKGQRIITKIKAVDFK